MPRVQTQAVQNDERQILQMRVVAQTTGPTGPNTSENHWSIFFLISNEQSVRANMATRKYGEIEGEMQWETQNYIMTNSAVAHWDFPVVATFKVSDFVSLVYTLGRDNYDMSGGGSGCRWWVYTIMCDLAIWGYVSPDVPSRLWPDMFYLYHKHLARKPLDSMPRGEFYPRLIPQPQIHRSTGSVPGGLPPGDWIIISIRDKSKYTPVSEWGFYEDLDGRPCLRNEKYNLCYLYPTGH